MFLFCLTAGAGLFVSVARSQGWHSFEVVRQANALSAAARYEDALGVLVAENRALPNQKDIVNTIKITFVSYCKHEISESERALAKNRANAAAYDRAARAYGYLGDNFRAMAVLTAGVMENPGAIPLWVDIAVLEAKAGRQAEAQSVRNEVLRLKKELAASRGSLNLPGN